MRLPEDFEHLILFLGAISCRTGIMWRTDDNWEMITALGSDHFPIIIPVLQLIACPAGLALYVAGSAQDLPCKVQE